MVTQLCIFELLGYSRNWPGPGPKAACAAYCREGQDRRSGYRRLGYGPAQWERAPRLLGDLRSNGPRWQPASLGSQRPQDRNERKLDACGFLAMSITIPNRCRSSFRSDGDHYSGLKAITF